MAREKTPADEAKVKTTPRYHVVRVLRNGDDAAVPGAPLRPGDRLEIVAVDCEGKTQLDTTDDVIGELVPAEQRNGEFGAFLSRSLKSDEYVTEQTVVTKRKSRSA